VKRSCPIGCGRFVLTPSARSLPMSEDVR
jgi:hypothetical protein